MKRFLSLFSVLTFVLLSLVVTTSQAAPCADSHQSLYQSIQPVAVVVTFEVFTPSVLCPCPVNLIDTYIETDLKPVLSFRDLPGNSNLYLTYFYLLNPISLAGNYFAPNVRKTIGLS